MVSNKLKSIKLLIKEKINSNIFKIEANIATLTQQPREVLLMNLVTTTELAKALKVTPQRIAALEKQLNIDKESISIKGRLKHFSPDAVKRILSHRGADYNIHEVIAFCNNKGGVGKSSVAQQISLRLSAMGYKVLLIDADPQGNSTNYFVGDREFQYVLQDVVSKSLDISDAILPVNENLSILPSSLNNSFLDDTLRNMTGKVNPITFFKNTLKKCKKNYNFILWDLSPSISTTNMLALFSATEVSIVTTLGEFSVQGVEMTFDVIRDCISTSEGLYKPKIKVLINKLDARLTTSLKFISEIEELGLEMYDSVIRTDNKIEKSQQEKTSLPLSSNAQQDINTLVSELISQLSSESATKH